MKKTAITLAVLVFLSLCLMISASAIIGGTATDVSFTQENVVGDPASAEGFSVQSLFTLEGHAHWDTTLTLGKAPTWNTDFSYTTIAQAMSYCIEPYVNLYEISNFSVYAEDIDAKEHVALSPFAAVLEEMAQEAPANARKYTKTLPLSEVMPYFPLALDSYATILPSDPRESPEMTDLLTRLFHIPTDGYVVHITIDTDGDKKLYGVDISVPDPPGLVCPGIVAGNSLYLAFEAIDGRTNEAIPGCAPFGVYRIPILNSQASPTLNLEGAEFVLPAEGNFIKLGTMEKESTLFLLSGTQEGGSHGTWIDTASGEIQQTIDSSQNFYDGYIFIEEDYVAILSGWDGEKYPIPQRATVWAKGEDGQYHETVDADFSQAMFKPAWPYAILYDQATGRLLITAYTSRLSPSLKVAVCQGDTMTYAATFRSSQDRLRETILFQWEEETPRLHLAQTP